MSARHYKLNKLLVVVVWGGGGHMKFSQIERGDQQFFCCFQGGIKNLTESFIPFLPHPPPPPRELKNDNSLKECMMSRAQWIHLALSPYEKKFACWPPPLGRRVSLLKLPNVNNVKKGGGGGGGGGEGCTYPITYKHGFCWISASTFGRDVSLSLLFSYTAVILWQDAIVVQVNILQCIPKHWIPHAGESPSVPITTMIKHFSLISIFVLPSYNYSELEIALKY